MTVPWGKIAAFGSLLTLVAVSPYLFGMAEVLLSINMQNPNVEAANQIAILMTGIIKAIVPLSVVGAFVFVFFQFAEEMA